MKLEILDTTGHKELAHEGHGEALEMARRAFDQAKSEGYSAFAPGAKVGKLDAFDPEVDIIMVPRVQGG